MSKSKHQSTIGLVSSVNILNNIIAKSLLLLVFSSVITLLFSSWGTARYSMGGYNAGQLTVTAHQLHFEGSVLNYTATTGYLPLVDKQEKPLANIFYVAYTAGNTFNKKRPIT